MSTAPSTMAAAGQVPEAVVLETAPCPLGCHDGDQEVLRGRDRLHRLPGEFRVVRCRCCGLLRTDPRPTPETIGYYYPASYRPYHTTVVSGPGALRTRRSRWRRALGRWLTPEVHHLPRRQPGRMLEIGCASGGFLQRMALAGWQVQGVEPSPEAARRARAAGLQVEAATVEAAAGPQQPVDLVVGWMVLEHLHHPLECLRKLRTWVRPQGWLVLSVPDASAWERRWFGARWYALQVPGHLYHYTPATLRRLLARGGWEVQAIHWHANPGNLLRSLAYLAEDAGRPRLGRYLEEIAEGRRHRYARLLLGRLLGWLRQSGRMTVWARPLP